MSNDDEDLADKLFRVEENFAESILDVPPEQRRLHTETYDFSIATVVQQLKDKHVFVPEFQRRYVWTQAQASRLVESLIIQCPIPVVYLSQEANQTLSVIDGNQRLQSLHNYLNNQFELRGLTAYPELEGKFFFQLDPRFQRHIQNRTIRCIVIMQDTHPQVKFDVFERLNTGSVKLTAQELRHGLYHGPLMKLAGKLAKNRRWNELFARSENKRMRLDEFVIRLLALHFDFEEYQKPLSAFLNSFCDKYRGLTVKQAEKFESVFAETVENLHSIYASYAFKLFDKEMKVLSSFNAALFDAEVLSASRLNRTLIPISPEQRQRMLDELAVLFEGEEFAKSVTRATSDEAQLRRRVSSVAKVVSRYTA